VRALRVSGQHVDDPIETDAAAGLDQHEVSGTNECLQKSAGALGVVEVVKIAVAESCFGRPFEQRARAFADADDGVDALRDGPAGVTMVVELFVAELQHVADDGDAAAGDVGLRHQSQRRSEGVGVGVVGIVVDRGPAGVEDDAAMVGRLERAHAARDPFP